MRMKPFSVRFGLLTFMISLIISMSINLSASRPGVNDKEENRSNPVEKIEMQSDGKVVIIIPDSILELILTEPEFRKSQPKDNIRPGINRLQGYRIQVFSDGRNQNSLESRAKARGSAIVAKFPRYRGQVYTYSSSPNWYTRIGNFRTSEEASNALTELKRAFPSFASEMRVVRSQIIIVK